MPRPAGSAIGRLPVPLPPRIVYAGRLGARTRAGGVAMIACGRLAWIMVAALALASTGSARAAGADECRNRGQLDALYCDDNDDLVADVPTDPKRWRDPRTINFAYTPVEAATIYQGIFKPFTDFLAQ